MEALGRLGPYVPRVVYRHLVTAGSARAQEVDGTLVFVDVSGFTRLSERLARRGREGAEHLAGAIGACFEQLLAVAYADGGSLLKFGGDALLLLFEGPDHVERGCRAALGMRRALRTAGQIETAGARIQLRMSAGVHSGPIQLYLAGGSSREFVVAGPGATEVVRMEGAAGTGEVLASAATAARLPARCLGAAKEDGVLLARSPAGEPVEPDEPFWQPPADAVAACLPTAVREHVLAGPQPPEHRTVTVAFLHFSDFDALVRARGAERAGEAIEELVDAVCSAADEHRVCVLGSDVAADGGKLVLAAGAPTATGEDEERMLLTLRRIADARLELPVRLGANSGAAFAGDIGPSYRRTYTVMGDVVNLAARLMARAPHGGIYVTARMLERSASAFHTTRLDPFSVKGKLRPIQAWALGPPLGRAARSEQRERQLPLLGRERETRALADALEEAARGHGRLVEIAAEQGFGRSRLLDAVRRRADGFRRLHTTCEPYTTSEPYHPWRELGRDALGVAADAADVEVAAAIAKLIERRDPALAPWLPLIAVALGAHVEPTPEVARLAPEFRAARLHEVVLRFLRAALDGPALIEIEDAHQMDHASVDLLHAAGEQAGETPWLIVVTRHDAHRGFVARPGAAIMRLELGPLGPEDTLHLAEQLSEPAPLPPAVLRLVAERSGGNPQFLRDLLRAAAEGVDELPDSIEAAATARIDQLAPADRGLVRRAAVLGQSFAERELTYVLDSGEAPPDEAVWRRLERYFAREANGIVRFRRAVVREAAYASLPFGIRRRLHALVAERLLASLGDAADDHAARLSLHFLTAGDHEPAWRFARIAADRAAAEFAPADAALLYRRALSAARGLALEPAEVAAAWRAHGDACRRTGELERAATSFAAARALVADDAVATGELLHCQALVAIDAGRVASAVRWVRRGLKELEPAGEAGARCRAQLVALLAATRQRQGRMEEAAAISRRAIADAEAAAEEAALAHALFVLDWALIESGRAEEAGHSQRALEIYTRLGDLDRQAAVLNNMGGFAYREGRWSEAVELYGRARDASADAGDAANAAFGDFNVGEVLSDQGRVERAETILRRALRVWRGSGYELGVGMATALLGRNAARAGRHAAAYELLEEAIGSFKTLRAAADAAWADALRAEALVFAGDAHDALALADRLLLDVAGTGRLGPLLHRVRGLALALLDDLPAAEGALGASLAEGRIQGEPYEIAVTLDALEALDELAGRGSDARRRRERDRILASLNVVALPRTPLSAAARAYRLSGHA